MKKYKIELDRDRMDKFEMPFSMRYEDGSDINFNNEGIGFMISVALKKIPNFIKDILEKRQYSANYSGAIAGEYGHVYIQDTFTDIPIDHFYDLCLQIAEKSLEAITVFNLKATGKIDDKWEQDIRSYIPRLKQLLDQ